MLARIKQFLCAKDTIIISGLILATIVLRVATLPLYPIPIPYIHDEQANMLGAETFSLGRLTNPSLLFPESLREIHVLSEPTRMMKYQPGTALFMALGIVAFGTAYGGIVLAIGLLIGSSYWAVKAWSNRTIALLIALFLLTAFRAPHYFMQSYWGGEVSMLGAMLMLGAYPRIFFAKQYRYHYFLMAGGVLLAITRPYEGLALLLGLALHAAYLFTKSFSPQEKRHFLRHLSMALLLIGGSYAALQAHYNHTISQHWWKLPYMAYQEQYNVTPATLGGGAHKEKFSTHPFLKQIQQWEWDGYANKTIATTIMGIISGGSLLLGLDRLDSLLLIAIPMCVFLVILIYLLPLYWMVQARALPNQRQKLAPLCIAWLLLMMGTHAIVGMQPHYMAVLLSVSLIMLATQLAPWLTAQPKSRLITCMLFSAVIFYGLLSSPTFPFYPTHIQHKENVIAQLAASEKSLVFVDATQEIEAGIVHESWVYNAPDIEAAPVIWAWYLSPGENARLIAHYNTRKLWYIAPSSMDRAIPYKDTP